jgi:prophage maintenance system killer protein
LLLAMTRERPFQRGNARIGLLAIAVFLNLNGRDLEATEGELVALAALGADGDLSTLQAAAVIERLDRRLATEHRSERAED